MLRHNYRRALFLGSVLFTFFLAISYTTILQAQEDSEGCDSFDDCGIYVEDNYLGNSSAALSKYSRYIVYCPNDIYYETDDNQSLEEAKEECDIVDPPTSPDNESALMEDSDECVITGNAVNVRSGPSTDFEPAIGVLNAGIELIATGQNNGWFNVNYNGQSAWVASGVVDATGDTCADLPFVDAPELPTSSSSDSSTSSELEGVSCLNFQRLSPPASDIAQTAVLFSWSEAEGAGAYDLVIYDFAGSVAGTFRTEQTSIIVNLGTLPLGATMSWEVRAFASDGAYACVTFNSGAIPVQANPNPEPIAPVETEQPLPVQTEEVLPNQTEEPSPEVTSEPSPVQTQEPCNPGSQQCPPAPVCDPGSQRCNS